MTPACIDDNAQRYRRAGLWGVRLAAAFPFVLLLMLLAMTIAITRFRRTLD